MRAAFRVGALGKDACVGGVPKKAGVVPCREKPFYNEGVNV